MAEKPSRQPASAKPAAGGAQPGRPPMPTFEKAPAELVDRFRTVLDRHPEAPVRKMFGYPAAFVNGNLATGLFGPSWMLRLPDATAAELLRLKGARPFEPMPGRAMRGYYVLPAAIVDDDTELEAWLGRALAQTATLPPKPTKG